MNQKNSSQLSEAIDLMFKSYTNTGMCLPYLANVKTGDDFASFSLSSTFTPESDLDVPDKGRYEANFRSS